MCGNKQWDENDKDFLLEEYKALRSEIELIYDLAERAERNALTLIVVVYGFIFSGERLLEADIANLMFFVPPLIAVFLTWRKHNYGKSMLRVGGYIESQLEPRFLGETGGWQAYNRIYRPKPRALILSSFFWLLVFVVGVALAVQVNYF